MSTPVTINTAPVCWKTSDGRRIKLESTIQAQMTLSIAFGKSPEESEGFPWSVLAAEFEFADSEGRSWRITSRFHSVILLRAMMDFSSTGGISPWKKLSADFRQQFEENIAIQNVWFSDDDRFIRPLIVGSKIKQVQFKYFAVSFDIAVIPNAIDDDLHSPDVFVRTSPMFSYDAKEIAPLCFPIDWKHFLVNMYSPDREPSDIPIPFIADLTDRNGQAQPNVVVLRD
jgi:hypothetical protein